MAMSERGMADMTEMPMAIPENTIPMMTGEGPFGSVEMGGMFSVVKIRADQPPGDYRDPGWFGNGPRAAEIALNEDPARSPAVETVPWFAARKPNPHS
jgi:hypothetical protein